VVRIIPDRLDKFVLAAQHIRRISARVRKDGPLPRISDNRCGAACSPIAAMLNPMLKTIASETGGLPSYTTGSVRRMSAETASGSGVLEESQLLTTCQ
jgi:hypothetical protein